MSRAVSDPAARRAALLARLLAMLGIGTMIAWLLVAYVALKHAGRV